jgi:hypothetical protein
MIKRTTRIIRPGGRIPKLTPPAQPGWYKRFKQLASLADKHFKIK